jgi:ribosomal protein S18 acetylase RimI-like enzyme
MTVKELSRDMIKNVLEIYKRAFNSDIKLEINLIKKYIKRKIYEIKILADNENIFGFSFIIPLQNYGIKNIVHIDYIAIDYQHQGKGYANILMNNIIEYYLDNSITLECEDKLIKFYEKFGFIKLREFEFKGKYMNFMIRKNKINIVKTNKILNILKLIQNPELFKYENENKNIYLVEIINPTNSIGVIKIDNIHYAKYDAWIRRRNYRFLK